MLLCFNLKDNRHRHGSVFCQSLRNATDMVINCFRAPFPKVPSNYITIESGGCLSIALVCVSAYSCGCVINLYLIQYDSMIIYDTNIYNDMKQYNTVQYIMIQCDVIWYDGIQTIRHNTIQCFPYHWIGRAPLPREISNLFFNIYIYIFVFYIYQAEVMSGHFPYTHSCMKDCGWNLMWFVNPMIIYKQTIRVDLI